MARKRIRNLHLPRYVTEIHGSYWYRPPKKRPQKIARVGDEKTLHEFMAARMLPNVMMIYMRDLIERYRIEILPSLSLATQKDYKRILNGLSNEVGHLAIDHITPSHVSALLKVDKHKAAANRKVAVLSAVFSQAVGKWFVCKFNPCSYVERNPIHRCTREVTNAEYKCVYKLASKRMRIAMDLAVLTGRRQSEILELRWSDVDTIGVPRRDWAIYFRQGKTTKFVKTEIGPLLEEVLKRARHLLPQIPRNFVLRNKDGLKYTRDGFRSVWNRLMRTAIKGRRRSNGTVSIAPSLSLRFAFDDLRKRGAKKANSVGVILMSEAEVPTHVTRRGAVPNTRQARLAG